MLKISLSLLSSSPTPAGSNKGCSITRGNSSKLFIFQGTGMSSLLLAHSLKSNLKLWLFCLRDCSVTFCLFLYFFHPLSHCIVINRLTSHHILLLFKSPYVHRTRKLTTKKLFLSFDVKMKKERKINWLHHDFVVIFFCFCLAPDIELFNGITEIFIHSISIIKFIFFSFAIFFYFCGFMI